MTFTLRSEELAASPRRDNPHFDIDVDLSHIFDQEEGSLLISDTWYQLARPRPGRLPAIQDKARRMLDNTLLHAQWAARSRRRLDRRKAIRVPFLSRVHIDGGPHLTSTDISLSGLRASGEPRAPIMDVEFKLPGLGFPIDARVEVMSYAESNVTPLVGLRFVNLERPYVEHIAGYIQRRRAALPRAA